LCIFLSNEKYDLFNTKRKKTLEIRTAEISLRRMLSSVISVIEGQAKKKDVKIILLNELKIDKLITDERRIKQVLLHYLSRML
jgi:signal transduction histidine kinase